MLSILCDDEKRLRAYGGQGLHWESLDEDLSVEDILLGNPEVSLTTWKTSNCSRARRS